MVIGYDGSRAFSEDRTGTENYSFQLLKALAKIDLENDYIVYVRSTLPGHAWRGWPKNFHFKEISWPRFWTQGGLALQTFKDNLDVLFVPAHTLPIFRKPGLKTVVTLHDLGAEYLPAMHQLKQVLYLKLMTHLQLKSATKIIAVSEATREDLVRQVGIAPGKIEVVYEGYDKDKFRVDILVNSLRKYELVSGQYFLFVGTVQPRKNLERLIGAYGKLLGVLPARYPSPPSEWAQHPRSTSLTPATRRESLLAVTPRNNPPLLVIAGSKGWLSGEIYKLPKKLGIEDKVKFLGYVPDEKLPALYSGAIALIFPSLFEGFGLPILEAQASGCPVITSNLSSMPEVGGRAALYVNPYSVDDIVKGMVRIKNLELRIKLIKQGFENVKRFSWEKCAAQTLEVFENLKFKI